MKIILLDDIKKVGKQYEVKNVKSGFARNFLIPQKKALPATNKNLPFFEKKKEKNNQKIKLQQELLIKNIEKLKEVKIKLIAPANEEGHLYAQIDTKTLVEALFQQAHIELPEDSIQLEKPFKKVGAFEVSVFVEGKEGKFLVDIEKESK